MTSKQNLSGQTFVEKPSPSVFDDLGVIIPSQAFAEAPDFALLQKKAAEYCATHPMPSAKDEMWRYTRPEQFSWSQLTSATDCPLKLEVFGDHSKQADGYFSSPSPAVATSFHSRKLIFDSNPSVENLQYVAAADCTTITIDRSQPKDSPLLLSRLIKGTSAPVIYIEIQKGVQCTIIEDLDSSADDLLFIPKTNVVLQPGSLVEFISLQRLADKSEYYGRFTFFLERDAQLSSLFLSLGAQVSRTDIECVMSGPGAKAEIGCLYLTDGKRHVDFHTEQQHAAPHCYSNLKCKGALRDDARGVYFGFIRVAEGSQKTDAYQKAKTMLLSKNARADNIPNLEIKANDVKCSHGASVSPVGGEELFYLKSRGISQQAAEILLLQGFFEDMLQKVSDKNIQEYCMSRVMERL